MNTRSSVLEKRENFKRNFFFHNRPNLKDEEFYYWKTPLQLRGLYYPKHPVGIDDMLHYLIGNRKEPSIIRSIYTRYSIWQKEKSLQNRFNTVSPFVIARSFDNPDIVARLLSSSILIPKSGRCEVHDLIWLFRLLKHHYSEQKIEQLIYTLPDNLEWWTETLTMIFRYRRRWLNLNQQVILEQFKAAFMFDYTLDIKQREIIDYMALPSPDNNDIQINKEDIENILSQGEEVKIGSFYDLQSLKENEAIFKGAKGAILLFELNNSTPMMKLNNWLETINEKRKEESSLIVGTRTKNDIKDIHLIMLCIHSQGIQHA